MWTEIDEQEFFSKLARARKDSRAQYLKVQAIELVDTKEMDLLKVAETLLLKMLNDYPEDNFNKSSALNTLGYIYRLREDYEIALDYYKKSLDFEKVYPNVITSSYIDYSELVIKLSKINQYSFIQEMLEPKLPRELFPVNKYKISLILAAVNKFNKEDEKAQYYSSIAEENASATTSGLRYHKDLGLVKERQSWLEKILNKK